jgi:hypothetical protein
VCWSFSSLLHTASAMRDSKSLALIFRDDMGLDGSTFGVTTACRRCAEGNGVSMFLRNFVKVSSLMKMKGSDVG